MRNLMIRVQDEAREIRRLQDDVLPKLKQQLAETKGVFKGKERKAFTEQILQMEIKISTMLDALPEILKEDGYPDVQAFMAIYRKAEAVVTVQPSPCLVGTQSKRKSQTHRKRYPRLNEGASKTDSGSCTRKVSNQKHEGNPLTEKGSFQTEKPPLISAVRT